jgi:nucleotide-binding universal stress UspA family protein
VTITTLIRPGEIEPTAPAKNPLPLHTMVVVDGCELSDATLERIRRIVRAAAADVLLLRPLEPRLALEPLEDSLADEASVAEAGRHLLEVAQKLADCDTTITTRVTTGLRKTAAIAETAGHYASDLIVLVDG